MEKSNRIEQSANDRLTVLVEQQKQCQDGTASWYTIQEAINQIVAERFLVYLNR